LAAKALGQFGLAAKEAVPALTKALKDANPRGRQEAAEALKQIDPEAAKKAGIKWNPRVETNSQEGIADES
jgi:HEAT repeat protein